MTYKTKAVVVGSGLNALGIVRSLAMAGVPVHLLYGDVDAAVHSRLASRQKIERTDGQPLVSALLEIGKSASDKPVLYLTEEKTVLTVSARRDELLPYFRIVLPAHDILTALMHKQGFQQMAGVLGSPVPQAVYLSAESDLAALGGLKYPCVLKPAVKDYAYGAKFQKAYVVQSPDEAAGLYRQIAPTLSDLIVQEWIEGTDSDIYFCLQYIAADGSMIASFVGRKIRSWPPRIGGTASCTAAPEYQEKLSALTTEFFRQVGFVGMGSMEFKRDPRDGEFYMVEPTVGRTDFQEEVATLHGHNLPLAAYCAETGSALPPVQAVNTRTLWREPVTDRWSLELQPELINPPGVAIADAYWRWNDPMPGIQLLSGRVIDRCRYLWQRLVK
jgi:predicted ATP-grasp superfamily ATP-dependent carboligase